MQVSRYVLAWLVVTLLVTGTAWAVVSTASDQVNDTPVAPIIDAGAITTFASTSTTSLGSLSTFATTTVVGSTPSSSPTTTPDGSSSTTAPATFPGTTIPDEGSSSTTTAPSTGSESGTKTIISEGGTVTVSYSNGQVFLDAATPAIGFSAEIEDTGPENVRVDFEGDDEDFSVRVEWKDGKLDIEID